MQCSRAELSYLYLREGTVEMVSDRQSREPLSNQVLELRVQGRRQSKVAPFACEPPGRLRPLRYSRTQASSLNSSSRSEIMPGYASALTLPSLQN